jgi:RNA methyltransferase, TrmH family
MPNADARQSALIITSPQNPLLQAVRQAASHGVPSEEGWIVAEGPHLLDEALGGTWTIHRIIATPAASHKWAHLIDRSEAPTTLVDDRAFAATAATESAQGILLLLRPRAWLWSDLLGGQRLVVVLDGVQDPGNAGTIIRSSEAFGASGIVLGKGSVQIANGKLVRAAAGSLFRLPALSAVPAATTLAELTAAQFAIYGLAPDAKQSLATADLRRPCALLVGNEGSGLSAQLLAAAQLFTIPTRGVESLNAAVACSIALFEAARQRGLA